MAKVERFEDLQVWRVARDVVNAIYKISSSGSFSRDYSLRDQVRQAAISVPPNIAEGFSRHSNKEFIQYLFIIKGSAAEAQSQLYIALDQNYISLEQFDEIYKKIETVAKQIFRFITYLKKRRITQ